MNKGFFSESIQNKALFCAMLEFNKQKFQTEMLAPDTVTNFIDSAFFTQPSYKKYALKQKTPLFFWDFAEESKRLALLDPKSLTELCLVLGACIHAKETAHVLDRENVTALKKYPGRHIYEYAVCRGVFQARFLKQFFAQKDTDLPLAEKIRKHGMQAVSFCTLTWQDELKQQFFKMHESNLPDLAKYSEENAALTPEQARMFWFCVKKLLVQEVNPAWRTYFN